MDHEAPVVETRQLTKTYGELTALDNVSLALRRGRILGVIGPNGAGKTTMIKILVGQARPTSGSATIAGADSVQDAPRIKQLVGYMPDLFGGYDNMRVREYLDFFGAAFQIPRQRRAGRIADVLEMTGATYMQDRYVESLSHGMKQRVGIARTLLHDPEVLILDEPANGLDPQARIEMREILLRLAHLGKSLIVTSHILPELSRICHELAILSQGRLLASGTQQEIMRRVSQRRTVEVQLVSADGVARATAMIREQVEPDAQVTAADEEAMVRFQTSKTESELAELLGRLVAAGLGVSQFRELQTDLEDTFLTITRATVSA